MSIRPLKVAIFLTVCSGLNMAQCNPTAASIDRYIQPYVQSGNFAGQILVARSGKIIFKKAYGFADRKHQVRNTAQTRVHIASMSMQFTGAAILRLVDRNSIALDQPVSEFEPGITGADKITIRDLLTERSGLPDINALPGYDDLLQHHQTPASLTALIAGRPLLFDPGSKFLHEEHSAYNLLALIVEKKTGLPFSTAVARLVFRPFGLAASGVDDDSNIGAKHMAHGYEPVGTYGLTAARPIHWSAKTGNASVFTTASDEAHWVDALFDGHGMSASSRDAMLDKSMKVGYGWFKGENKRFGQAAYFMNGRAPGFASFVLYLPDAHTTVVVLSNIYSSATTTIGNDIAAIALGLPYLPFQLRPPSADPVELEFREGVFQFGPDFFQANAVVSLLADGRELSMRWPSGDVSPLIPVKKDQWIDRSYWEEVRIERDASGKPAVLIYDRFRGIATKPD
jgi:CubicO group peptidase (beta-lactamase class C family)